MNKLKKLTGKATLALVTASVINGVITFAQNQGSGSCAATSSSYCCSVTCGENGPTCTVSGPITETVDSCCATCGFGRKTCFATGYQSSQWPDYWTNGDGKSCSQQDPCAPIYCK